MDSSKIARGKKAEDLVADYLRARGYHIAATNARAGRLEIDLIATRTHTIVFCEVRSRGPSALVHPALTIDIKKRNNIRRAAAAWLRDTQQAQLRARWSIVRFDAAAVRFESAGPLIDYYENAF